MSRRLRRWAVIASVVLLVASSWGAWRSRNVRRARRLLAEARAAAREGRHATAAHRLVALVAEGPESDEAAYLLGTCEKARGREAEAAEAWRHVSPGSPFGMRAVQRRMELEVDRGRFAEAERLIERARSDPRLDTSALPLYLGPVYWLQGRVEEAMEAVESRWEDLDRRGEGASEKAIELVRLHIELGHGPLPVELVRDGLDRAGKMDADDDRVWLGKANLALREGAFDRADRWLSDCLHRRPGDRAVCALGSIGPWRRAASKRSRRPPGACRPTRRTGPGCRGSRPGWPHVAAIGRPSSAPWST